MQVEQKIVNKKNVQIIHLTNEKFEYSVELDNWNIVPIKPNYIYDFQYFTFKKGQLVVSFNYNNIIFLFYLGNELKLINNQFSEIIEIKQIKKNIDTSNLIQLKQLCVSYFEVSKFAEITKETNFSINCTILDVIFKNTYITLKLCDTTGTKVYSNIWDPHNLIGLEGNPTYKFTFCI